MHSRDLHITDLIRKRTPAPDEDEERVSEPCGVCTATASIYSHGNLSRDSSRRQSTMVMDLRWDASNGSKRDFTRATACEAVSSKWDVLAETRRFCCEHLRQGMSNNRFFFYSSFSHKTGKCCCQWFTLQENTKVNMLMKAKSEESCIQSLQPILVFH